MDGLKNMQYLPTWTDRFFVTREAAVETPASPARVSTADAIVNAAVVRQDAIAYVREIFAIAGHRVTRDATSGWKCECTTFAPAFECDHVKEAVRLQSVRQARR